MTTLALVSYTSEGILSHDREDSGLDDRDRPPARGAAQCRRDGSVRHLLVARRDVLAGLAPPGRNRTRDREDIELGN